ncbi:MAG: hypothetical protein KDD42_01185 [Bdellovibrionales bacterium]|nr:hypothetical protein [Bdellovibrionales bacterium]
MVGRVDGASVPRNADEVAPKRPEPIKTDRKAESAPQDSVQQVESREVAADLRKGRDLDTTA